MDAYEREKADKEIHKRLVETAKAEHARDLAAFEECECSDCGLSHCNPTPSCDSDCCEDRHKCNDCRVAIVNGYGGCGECLDPYTNGGYEP